MKPYIQILFIALSYFLLGQFGSMYALPPGFASPLWLPAGVAALAGLFCSPGVAVVGIGLGTLSTNLVVASGTPDITLWWIWLVFLGASLHAYWCSRIDLSGADLCLHRLEDVVRAYGHMGILGCCITATFGTTSMLLAGVITPDLFLWTWITWWLGDTIGVILLAPVGILAFGCPDCRRRAVHVASTSLVMTFILSIFLYLLYLEASPVNIRWLVSVLSFILVCFVSTAVLLASDVTRKELQYVADLEKLNSLIRKLQSGK